MNAPRSAPNLLAGTFELYRRYPWLFLALAAGVIVPYELIALATTHTGPFSRADASLGAQLFLELSNWVLVTPLISALHVHAVADVRAERKPLIGPVALRGLKVLPVVAAATIVAWLGTIAGFLALILPGIYLVLRWAVVAQAAAIENEGWLPALRRSGRLSEDNYLHIAIFLVMVGAITSVPFVVGGIFFGHHNQSVAAFLTGLAVKAVVASFAALASALLYYDLVARWDARAEPVITPTSGTPDLDPRAYADQDRPKGWYVDPASPNRMRYWASSDPTGWRGTTRTPWRIRRAWRAQQKATSDR